MQPSTNSFQKPARRSFADGGLPSGQDPLAGQYGHAAVGAPVDQGAAMDRKVLAQNTPAAPPKTAVAQPMRSSFTDPAQMQVGMSNLGFADGGVVSPLSIKGIGRSMGFFQTPQEKAAAVTAKYAAQDAEFKQRQAAKPAATAVAHNDTPAPMGSQSVLDKRMATAGLRNGGLIKGPGTATSDSIPAKVAQTGEPIQVSTGERIVSAAQEKVLQQIAQARGYKSVDEMFHADTGKPVGPTIKGGKKAAETGMSSRYHNPIDDAINAEARAKVKPGSDLASKGAVLKAMATDAASLFDLQTGTTGNATKQAIAQQPTMATTPVPAAQANPAQPKAAAAPSPTAATPAPYRPAVDSQKANPKDMTAMLAGNGKLPQDLSALQQGQIYKTMGKNGSPIYSGVNVTGDAPMVSGNGMPLQGRGSVSVVPAMAKETIKSALTNPDGSTWTAADNALMAANLRDGVDPYRGTSRQPQQDLLSKPMNRSQRAAAVQMAQTEMQGKHYAAANAIAQGQLDISKQGHAFKQDQAKQLADAQAAYTNPKATPAEREAAKLKLIAMGAFKPTNWTYHPGTKVTDPMGTQTVTDPVAFNPETAETRTPGGPKAPATPRATYDTLPKGATYTGTDGQQYTKG